MFRGITKNLVSLMVALATVCPVVLGQPPTPEDEAIDAMRTLASISSNDQLTIRRWVQQQFSLLADEDESKAQRFKAFRAAFTRQRVDPTNAPAFVNEFASKVTDEAKTRFEAPDLDPLVAQSLGRVLMDLNRVNTTPALLAGLECDVEAARYLCAKALVRLRSDPVFSSEPQRLSRVVAALREAGLKERGPAVLRAIYMALGYDDQLAEVFDVYLAILDKRLGYRKGSALRVDGAEVGALTFFLRVGGSLNADQRKQLVQRLAVFLRLDAERYQALGKMTSATRFTEIDHIERQLAFTEELLEVFTSQEGGLRRVLQSDGIRGAAAVPTEAYLWVGDPKTATKGTLNNQPWGVPIGAP